MKKLTAFLLCFLLAFNLTACYVDLNSFIEVESYSISDIPDYSGSPFVYINENEPFFEEEEIFDESFEYYSELDYLGRCGMCVASISEDIMPQGKRENISSVKPTGWHSVKYEGIDGDNLYNRCHLIGYQLTGENANKNNLITGTRYLNVEGMLPFENMVDDYIEDTDNHVMYRVTPFFEENNLLANGVLIEAYSVEDEGDGISFCVYCYNVQPGIEINYKDGTSKDIRQDEEKKVKSLYFILNIKSKKFHNPDCSGAKQTKEENKEVSYEMAETLIAQGYEPCGSCNPR